MFKKVNPKQSFSELEKNILNYWDKNDIFAKSVENRKDNERFVFFDGPPFANGLPHYGHILALSLKDAVTRYWTMKGFFVPRTNGWDCHGLPVEYEIEKDLGLSGKKDIEDMGIECFNNKCRESVFKYTKEWSDLFKRLGRWVDFDSTYVTLDNNYIESIWWVFKQIWLKEMVYKGYKSMHICPRCETPLSNFEVSQGYKDKTDVSVVVKFKLLDEDVYVLAWTTTPWTLPGNVALAIGKNIKYSKVKVLNDDNSEDVFIVAKNLVEKIFKDKKYSILGDIDPKELSGKKYKPLFDYYNSEIVEKGAKICLADFVTTEDGTGVVHIAPMFGEDDYNLSKEYDLPLIQHVKMNGVFKDEVLDFAGKTVKGQDLNIVEFLKKNDLVFSSENFRHSYPHCWRCDTPLLNYSTKSWFIKVSDVKPRLLKNNKKINWQPPHIKDGRFGKWLEGARDWAISRNRFWGAPIPVWECECGNVECVGSIEELSEFSGGVLPKRGDEVDLHRPYIDEIIFPCKKCGKDMKRVSDVLDCWFESGAMPYAQLHYPFENRQEFEDNFPANFIAEGLDQTRGWFYTLHVLASILFDKPAFKNVIVNGILLASDGEKLSKRKKNYPDPSVLFENQGVDSLRMFLYSSTASLAEDVRFSEKHVDEIVKNFTLTIWNAYSFFVTYAEIDNWSPDNSKNLFDPSNSLDKWILSELHELIKTVTEEMDDYNLTKATRPIIDFADNLSNWYIRRSRRRFWKSENDSDKNEAYQTLYTVLVEFTKLIAPFMPFLADEIYINLTGKESVHLDDWPKYNNFLINPNVNMENKLIRKIVTLGHFVRDKAGIKVRQPLALVQIALPVSVKPDFVLNNKDVILEELNIKDLKILDDAQDMIRKVLKPDARKLGPKYGSDVQNIIKMAKLGEFTLNDDGSVKVGDYVLESDEVEVGFEGKDGFDVASLDGISVILDTNISSSLKKEGYARDIVRFIQDLRKEALYNVDDRINVFVETDGLLKEAILEFSDFIKRETLALKLEDNEILDADIFKEVSVDGIFAKIFIKK